MSTAPQGGVGDQTGGHGTEQGDHLGRHHWLMGELLAHPQSPDRHDACGWSAATLSLEVGGGGFFQGSGRGTAHGPNTFDVYLVASHRGQARLVRGRTMAHLGQHVGRRVIRWDGDRADPPDRLAPVNARVVRTDVGPENDDRCVVVDRPVDGQGDLGGMADDVEAHCVTQPSSPWVRRASSGRIF